MIKQNTLSKQKFQLIGIDSNNNVTHAHSTKKGVIENLLFFSADEGECNNRTVSRIIGFDLYRVPFDFVHVTCQCMIKDIKEIGTRIESNTMSIKIDGHACITKNKMHSWKVYQMDKDGIIDYFCRNCDRIKSVLKLPDCPLCHREQQPFVSIIKPM